MDARRQRATLQRIARLAMLERGIAPDFSTGALEELARITDPPVGGDGPVPDHSVVRAVDKVALCRR